MPDDARLPELDIPPPGYRVSRRRLDAPTRRLALIAGGLLALLLAIGGVWALSGHRADSPVPVVEADTRPIRIKPANPGGMQVAGADEAILSGQANSAAAALAAPPEAPAPQALLAQQQAARPAPPATPASAPAPETAPTAHGAPIAAAPDTHPPPAAAPAPHATARQEVPAGVGHPTGVQLGALDSETAARQEWDRLSRRMPDLLAGRHPSVIRADLGGRTLWRLRMGGFADVAQAAAFCERVRAKGAGCAVASF
ncbi:MAG: SPOR domain-containing protein [Acidisphaera sp.]|nr:SPOR domain-containing protein [Acidisphaera sp.]